MKNTKIDVANNYNGNVIADKSKLTNVIINIIYNALDAIQENSNGLININVNEAENNMLKITIANNGSAISQETQERIFEEGFTSKNTGSGLGLYISKEAMKEQYGDLVLLKSDDNETIFEITVPKL